MFNNMFFFINTRLFKILTKLEASFSKINYQMIIYLAYDIEYTSRNVIFYGLFKIHCQSSEVGLRFSFHLSHEVGVCVREGVKERGRERETEIDHLS